MPFDSTPWESEERFHRLFTESAEQVSVMLAIQLRPEVADRVLEKAMHIARKNIHRLQNEKRFVLWFYRIVVKVYTRMNQKNPGSDSGSPDARKHRPK